MTGHEPAPEGVKFTNLDQELFDGAGVTKGELVDYLGAVAGPFVAALTDRPLSVIRVHSGGEPFMQKNLPKYTPPWVPSVSLWAEASQRQVRYALANDRRTLLWLGNQRAVEYHPALVRSGDWAHPTHLVLDLDPPEEAGFDVAVRAAHLIRQVLDELGMTGVPKTSGAKGVHVFVPVEAGAAMDDVAAATRAIAARAERLDPDLATTAFIREDRGGRVFLDATRVGGATVVSVYSPRVRPGVPVSFPVSWDDLDSVKPGDFTIRTVPGHLEGGDPWVSMAPGPQPLDPKLVEEGHAIPGGRVQAMHEGKRRKRQARQSRDE